MQEQKEITIQDIIAKRKKHARKVDTKLITRAYKYALQNHGDQCRRSGEPYIIHPLNVAYILADIGLDDSTVCAALLHDVVEDTKVTQEDITREFGQEISDMVAGVTKLGNMQFTSVEEQQVEDYRKMKRDNKTLDQIYDLFALRILVNSVKDCYAALGVVHELYSPMPGRFKDYIAVPKPNMYQSIHTTLLGEKGTPFEVQIRTWEMHRIAEYGIAAHWAYKEASYFGKKESVKVGEDKLAWLRETLEWQKEMQDPQEFLDTLKTELFEDEVYVFTPKGKIKVLPRGATPIDFAYSIHAEIGHHMIGAKINSKMMPIITPLKSGDIVEILTSDNSKGPSRDWLKFVKSSSAKNKIKGWFKKAQKTENIEKGKDLIEKELKRIGVTHTNLFKTEYIQPMLDKYRYKNIDEMYAAVGFGANSPVKVIARMLQEYRKEHEEENIEEKIQELAQARNNKPKPSNSGIIVKGIDNCLVKLSKCCNPLPGDEIVGYITKGRGVSVHRKDCTNIKDLLSEENRMIDVEWYKEEKASYQVDIEINSNDRNGLLLDILKEVGTTKAKILGVNTKVTKEKIAIIDMTLEVENLEELNKAIKVIRKVDSVYEVRRKK